MKRRALTLALALVAGLLLVGPAAAQGGHALYLPIAYGPAPAPPAPDALAGQVIELINRERAARGLAPLAGEARLAAAAAAHAADMAANDFVGHLGSDGAGPAERLERVGYAWSACGEVVAGGQPSPAAVVAAWMASEGHRAILLGSAYTEVGAGRATSAASRYGTYWVALLAAP
ncbi:MAG: hypothetical protein GX657_04235 [Chloroflexi bacterium]|nr:hypothetical protein [Chloroflexota bacterium]